MKIHFNNQSEKNNTGHTLLSRDSLFGDGFFTTGRIIAGKIEFQHAHFERLRKSAEILQFSGIKLDLLESEFEDLVKDVSSASFRLSIYRSQRRRGYAISPTAEIESQIYLFPKIERPQNDCRLILATTPISTNSLLAGIKHLNRLDNVLAASEVKESDQEALMFDKDHVICGTRTNLFVLIDGIWKTPCLDKAGIAGITRQRVFQLMEKHSIDYFETDIPKSQLKRSQAAFMTNSLLGIWPVSILFDRILELEPAKTIQELYNLNSDYKVIV